MQLRFWGVRGSVPSPGPETAGVGGNTSCVEVRIGDFVAILDAGTGMRRLGEHLLREAGPDGVRAAILFSHVHWDHIQGFPFFTPVFDPRTRLTLYGSPREGALRDIMRKQMTYPTFPVALDDLPSRLEFAPVETERSFAVGPLEVTAAVLNHPNGVHAYRLAHGGRAIVYATDTEHYPDGRIDDALVALARDADVLIYDAQYTPAEYDGRTGVCRHGWGHSTWVEGVRVAEAAGVDQLVLFHHDPGHDDAAVAAIEAQAAAALPGTIAAREGLTLRLDRRARRAA